MAWVELVALLALVEYLAFGVLVGRARATHGVKAPAITGNEIFERYFRVQQNTLEVLIVFLPALWISAQYWKPYWIAAIGALYLVGRIVYLNGYVRDPKARSIGFGLSMLPTLILVIAALAGSIGHLVSG